MKISGHMFFNTPINLSKKSYVFEIKPTALFEYKYTLKILSTRGNPALTFTTDDGLAMQALLDHLGYTIAQDYKTKIINEFLAVIGKKKDKNIIDKFYTSLPPFLYLDDDGLQLEGDQKILCDDDLVYDLKTLLSGNVNDRGSNEERGVVNIVKAISYDRLLTELKLDNLLFKIYDSIDGDEYKSFTSYLTRLIKFYKAEKTKAHVVFSNEYWMFRDIHVEPTATWKGGKITFKNYEENNKLLKDAIGWLVSPTTGKDDIVLDALTDDPIPLGKQIPLDPLALVTLETNYPNATESPKTDVLAFELYNKVNNQTNWDYFNIATDIIGVATIVGGTYSIAAKGASMGVRAIAVGAGVAKEISSILIQNKKLNTWMAKEHPEVYSVWSTLDTAGDLAYMLMSLPELVKVVKGGGKVITHMGNKGYEGTKAFLKSLEKMKAAFFKRFLIVQTNVAKITTQTAEFNRLFDEVTAVLNQLKKLEGTKIKWNTGAHKNFREFDDNIKRIKIAINQIEEALKKTETLLKELNTINRNAEGIPEIVAKTKKELDVLLDAQKKLKKQQTKYAKVKEHTNQLFNKYIEDIAKNNKEELMKFLGKVDSDLKATDLEKVGINTLYRGSTRNNGKLYSGNTNSIEYGLSTSTDPLRATIFAIESSSQSGRKGILQIIFPKDLKNIKLQSPNERYKIELEIIVQVQAKKLIGKSVEIPVEKARKIVKKVYGIDLETKLDSDYSRYLLENLPKNTIEKSNKFYLEILKNI